MTRKKPNLYLLALLIIIVSSILGGCGKKDTATSRVEAKPVSIGKVRTQDIQIYYDVTGSVAPVQDVIVSSEVSGTIIEKMVDEYYKIHGWED